ncbi:MAG: GIY-YIG nuclease family protein, partial [Candidatus Pacebacteria bacterium]|nr:GIY-YIG nuclease family protein [Candidatus Paceibacterota bacterium]
MVSNLFPSRPESSPTIYAYKILGAENRKGLLKVGFTNRDARTRINEQLGTAGLEYEIVLEESAMRSDGSGFSDHEVHKQLVKDGFIKDQEWFNCEVEDVISAIIAIKDGEKSSRSRTLDFGMRPEQQEAVDKAANHFRDFKKKEKDKTPHFLWNAKMRFGKTFTAYQLAR